MTVKVIGDILTITQAVAYLKNFSPKFCCDWSLATRGEPSIVLITIS
jgi:hypothetical protein